MRALRSSAVRLAVGYIALGLAALALFAAPLWLAWRVTVDEGRTEILQADAQRLTDIYQREGAPALRRYIEQRVGLNIAYDRLLLLADSHLQPLAGNLTAWPRNVPASTGSYTLPLDLRGGHTKASLVLTVLANGDHLLVGRDLARFVPLERRFWYALAGAVAILSVFGTLGGILVRRALMGRIHAIRAAVAAIMQGDLTRRLPTLRAGDELNTLAQTINRMLTQIEQLVHGVRNVSNSIAHDLRTPLAELRARLEELSLTRPSSEHTFAEIEAAVTDVDRVISIFNALLRLAEIDSGMRRSGFVPVDIVEVAAAAVDFYQPAAELRGSRLQLVRSDVAPVRGDPVLLAQALSNLIDNALKYTPEGGDVIVSITRKGEDSIEVAVADSGPGIPDQEKRKVRERFYRGDASRGTPGVGLGLSLVDAVARLHGSELVLRDNAPGLRASILLGQDTRHIERLAPAAAPHQGELPHEPVYL
jgi:signal transduction histidine kinase